MVKRFVSAIFTVEPERYGVDPQDDVAVAELFRHKMMFQPFEWELEEYSLEESIGTEEK